MRYSHIIEGFRKELSHLDKQLDELNQERNELLQERMKLARSLSHLTGQETAELPLDVFRENGHKKLWAGTKEVRANSKQGLVLLSIQTRGTASYEQICEDSNEGLKNVRRIIAILKNKGLVEGSAAKGFRAIGGEAPKEEASPEMAITTSLG